MHIPITLASLTALGSEGRPPSSCSAGPSRPASETPRSLIERDHKRKIQDDITCQRLKSGETKMRGKRTKHRSSSSPSEANISGGRRSAMSKAVTTMTNANCDNVVNSQAFSGVPYVSAKNGLSDVQNNNTMLSNGSTMDAPTAPVGPMFPDVLTSDASAPTPISNSTLNADSFMPSQAKLPIPRLPKSGGKQNMSNFMNVQYPSPFLSQHQQPQQQSTVASQKQKYKPIKPKPALDEVCMKVEGDVLKQLPQCPEQNGAMKGMMLPQKGGNDAIIGCLEKDALDDYLHGGSNSQEQEEELMQYFPQQAQANQNQAIQMDTANGFDKISQLRLLLERNMNQDLVGKAPQFQNGMSAAASLSLLSQRSQQKQNLILPSLLSSQQNSARRVSFEVPVDPDSVPPSPNTKQRFSFTPISPRPYSPTKSSSANVSPFVSPRNTPIPRRMSTQPSSTFMQSASSMYSAKAGIKGYAPRTIMRSTSVNIEACSMSPCQTINHSQFSTSGKHVDVNPMNMDVKPDINALQNSININDSQTSNFSPAWNPTSQNITTALPPLQLPRGQNQVSMSAPQSPVVPCSKSMKRNSFFSYNPKEYFRKEARAHSFDMDDSNMMSSGDFKNQADPLPCQVSPQIQNTSDKYSQEVSGYFPEDEALYPSMSSFRSQSVPLRRMVNSVAMSPMPSTALPSPHYGPPPTQQGFFNFNPYTPGSSVAPTPVPSEFDGEFGVDSDAMHPSNGNVIELIREDFAECNTSHAEGMTTESLNPDILNEMINMFEAGKGDAQQQSQDFPQTPELYKPDPETTLRGDPLFSSFRLQTVGSECGSCSEEQIPLRGTRSSNTNSADPILNELGSIANESGVQPGMESLLEEAPSSFMTEDLECELSQLSREVGNPTS